MTSRLAITIALALALSAGAALAQTDDQPSTNFYGDPVLPDPPLKATHVFPASIATQDVAAVAPLGGGVETDVTKPVRASKNLKPASACTSLNPCAVSAPAARG